MRSNARDCRYDEGTVLDLVGRIYRSATSPELWPDLLECLAERLGSIHVSFIFGTHTISNQSAFSAAVRANPDAVKSYNEHYWATNPFYEP